MTNKGKTNIYKEGMKPWDAETSCMAKERMYELVQMFMCNYDDLKWETKTNKMEREWND